MKIAYNPIKAAALTEAPDNYDITFDLSGIAIYARGVKFDGKAPPVFKKHTSENKGGYNGLVPVPSYNNNSITRFLKEDGKWEVPINTSYTFADGIDGSFTVTPSGGSDQKVSIGKPATAGTADKVANSLTLKIKSGTTEGTNLYTYDGSEAKILDIKAGDNITLIPEAGKLTIAATSSDTTYTLSGALNENTFITTLTPSSGDVTKAIIPAMVGATNSTAGKAGLVPAPGTGKNTLFLRSDGTWATYAVVSNIADGLAPKIGTAAADTIATLADEWVLTSTKGGTPTWRKLPTNAFNNTNYYRPILVNGTTILGNNNTALNLVAGTNISIVAENSSGSGKVTITNTGVRSVTTGDTNGTISVDTNGTSANIAVKGLGSAAYTASTDYAVRLTLTNQNLNNVITPGFYNAGGGNTVTNKPSEVTSFGLEVIHIASGDYYVQILYQNSNSVWRRRCNDGTWSSWTKDACYSVVSSSANGLAPKVINTNTATVGSDYYVLASTNGSATPSWYKLPTTAFANDDTKVTQTNTTGSASYRVLLSGNANDTTETTTARKSGKLLFNPNTGALTSTTFIGNLDGIYVNKLTGYAKATAIGSIAATDTLNTALGKLEYKTDFIYNDLFGTDNDDVINKWHEIVDFIDSVAEDTDITDEFVTRKTAQTITGAKTFSKAVTSTVANGTAPFIVTSSTLVSNLNADLLDGHLGSWYLEYASYKMPDTAVNNWVRVCKFTNPYTSAIITINNVYNNYDNDPLILVVTLKHTPTTNVSGGTITKLNIKPNTVKTKARLIKISDSEFYLEVYTKEKSNTWYVTKSNSRGSSSLITAYTLTDGSGTVMYEADFTKGTIADYSEHSASSDCALRLGDWGTSSWADANNALKEKPGVYFVHTSSGSNYGGHPSGSGIRVLRWGYTSGDACGEGLQTLDIYSPYNQNGVYIRQGKGDGTNMVYLEWKKIATTTDLNSYLPLAGGTLTGQLTIKSSTTSGDTPKLYFQRGTETDSYYDNYIYNTGGGLTFGYSNSGTNYDLVKITSTTLRPNSNNTYDLGSTGYKWANVYTTLINGGTPWHSGNFTPSNYLLASSYTAADILDKLKTVDGSGSGLDADLLDGTHKGDLLEDVTSSKSINLSITVGGTTESVTDLTSRFTSMFSYTAVSNTNPVDLNTHTSGGIVRNYSDLSKWTNVPSGMKYGEILNLAVYAGDGLGAQLAWDINNTSTTNTTRNLFWRARDYSNGFTYSKWKQIAFTNGYHIAVQSSAGTDANTIYFVT